jgi:pimeloyl-ACP methyl ester carboxylesterase
MEASSASPGWLSRFFAGAVLVVAALLGVAGVAAPWSRSGWVLLSTAAAAAVAFLLRPARLRAPLGGLAVVAFVALLGARLVGGAIGVVRMGTLPDAASSRWLGRLVDEQDVSLLGARLVARGGLVIPEERAGLPGALHDAYVEMRGEVGMFPSPVLDTVLGRQSAAAFDALFVDPRAGAGAEASAGVALVFLHGYGGSFTLECWLAAAAARTIGAVTVCPSIGVSGHWGSRQGERTLRATLDYLRGRGIGRVYLAGLSNGAAGASALAPRFASALAGLILISGAPAGGTDGGLPTLVVEGERDRGAAAARAFVAHTHARYVGLDGGHFVLLTRRAEARAAIAGWLRGRERGLQ